MKYFVLICVIVFERCQRLASRAEHRVRAPLICCATGINTKSRAEQSTAQAIHRLVPLIPLILSSSSWFFNFYGPLVFYLQSRLQGVDNCGDFSHNSWERALSCWVGWHAIFDNNIVIYLYFICKAYIFILIFLTQTQRLYIIFD